MLRFRGVIYEETGGKQHRVWISSSNTVRHFETLYLPVPFSVLSTHFPFTQTTAIPTLIFDPETRNKGAHNVRCLISIFAISLLYSQNVWNYKSQDLDFNIHPRRERLSFTYAANGKRQTRGSLFCLRRQYSRLERDESQDETPVLYNLSSKRDLVPVTLFAK